MITKGANIGMEVLYVVVGALFLSLAMFFLGNTDFYASEASDNLLNKFIDNNQFFVVFAIVFPGFIGMTAGVGLSGDLKDPSKSIPWGTLSTTLIGMVVYVFIAYKLAVSASSEELLGDQLIQVAKKKRSKVYVDTMISPSYTSAIAQSLQLPSISGQDVNLFLFEYSRHDPAHVKEIIENYPLVKSAEFDACVLSTSEKGFGHHKEIHIWITPSDFKNANLMILLGYIILEHPEWKKAQIKILAIFPQSEVKEQSSIS